MHVTHRRKWNPKNVCCGSNRESTLVFSLTMICNQTKQTHALPCRIQTKEYTGFCRMWREPLLKLIVVNLIFTV